jgi:hypothetical protein
VLVLRPVPTLVLSIGLLAAPSWAQQSSTPPAARPPDKAPAPATGAPPAAPKPANKPAAPSEAKPTTPEAKPTTPAAQQGSPAPKPAAAPDKPAAVPELKPGTPVTGAKPATPASGAAPTTASPASPASPPAAPAAAPPAPAAGAPKPALAPAAPTAAPSTAKSAGPPPSPAQVKKARELWYRGVDAFRNGRYEEARQAFSECYTLMPKSDVLRNLSISEIQSGHYVSAARHLALLLSGSDLPANVREEATKRLEQAEAQIGKLNVNVDVPGAIVNIDGSPIGRTPLDGPWYIEPGQHEINIGKPGYPDETRQIYALGGVAIPVTVSLEALRREQERDAHAAELMGTSEGETPRERGLSTASTITLISTGTLAAAGLIAGIYFTASANDHDSDADAMALNLSSAGACQPTTKLLAECQQFWKDQDGAINDRRKAQISFIGFGVASAATLGYAVYVLLDDEGKPKGNTATRQLEPGLALSADGASFSLHGRF